MSDPSATAPSPNGAAPAVVRDGRVLRARISYGHRGTLDGAVLDELGTRLEAIAGQDPGDPDGVGAVLLLGEGENFCTGGDVRAFASAADRHGYVRGLADTFHRFLRPLVGSPVPTVAAVRGWAAGAGMSIVCATDIAVAGRSTKLRPAYPGIGFSPDGGMTWTLPRLVGAARARRILLTDEVLDAATALETGVVATVVDDDDVLTAAERTAHRLAQGPTAALGRIRGLLTRSWDATLDEQLEAEAAAIAAGAAGPEGTEGLRAFAEKRAPRFH